MPLRNLRRARTLNQEQLAAILGVSQQTLSKYEKGILVPDVHMQARIAAIFGVSRADIFPIEAERIAS
jgi:putative transcriptional regulator